jgi:hypothetical protein
MVFNRFERFTISQASGFAGGMVTVSSGYSDDPVLSKFQDFGFSEVLAKPYKADDLVEVIYKVLDGVKG